MNKFLDWFELKYRLITYIVVISGLFYLNYDVRISVLAAITSSALELNLKLSSIEKQQTSNINDLNLKLSSIENKQTDKIAGIAQKIDQIKENGCLLEDGTAWHKGAEMIDTLKAGEMILASNLVSWNKDNVQDYITANKKALKNGIIIKRLYANTDENLELAKNQLKWIQCVESKQRLERKMYDSKEPMLDYILAIDQNNIPKWAVLWIYSPAWASSIVHGFIIKDKNILEGIHTDFNNKWDHPQFTTQAPS